MSHEVEITVLGGLPITVEFETEQTSFALNDSWVTEISEWEIVAVAGRYVKKAPEWIYKRLTGKDEESILEACYDAIA